MNPAEQSSGKNLKNPNPLTSHAPSSSSSSVNHRNPPASIQPAASKNQFESSVGNLRGIPPLNSNSLPITTVETSQTSQSAMSELTHSTGLTCSDLPPPPAMLNSNFDQESPEVEAYIKSYFEKNPQFRDKIMMKQQQNYVSTVSASSMDSSLVQPNKKDDVAAKQGQHPNIKTSANPDLKKGGGDAKIAQASDIS